MECEPCDGSSSDDNEPYPSTDEPCCPVPTFELGAAPCADCGHTHGKKDTFHHDLDGHLARILSGDESRVSCSLAHLSNLAMSPRFAGRLVRPSFGLWEALQPLITRKHGLKAGIGNNHALKVLNHLSE